MKNVSPLPDYLVTRYRDWKTGLFLEKQEKHARLASEGQSPKVMVISCCDSRVHVTSIFGAETGEFFIHRNVANLVPPFTEDNAHHGTSAAIEFAVTALKIEHLIVLGHSQCGGVRYCHDTCHGDLPQDQKSFVARWMDILRPGYERVKHIEDDAERITALELTSVVVAIENLQEFPFIQEAMASGQLSLHGLWHSIGDGVLMAYNTTSGNFEPLD
ncbi:MAG TPA: carbonic anhydrase [Rhodobacteraceae bacterium]|nr:carbonic anhydrase [Paracoccaceae bacterium]